MKRRITSLLLSMALVVSSICIYPTNGKVVDAATQEFDCTYQSLEKGSMPEYEVYGAKSVKAFNADEAERAGVPEGYTGDSPSGRWRQ